VTPGRNSATGFHHLSIPLLSVFGELADAEHGKSLRDGKVHGNICKHATGANAPTEAEGETVRIAFRVCAEEALRVEGQGIGVSGWVVQEPPEKFTRARRERRKSKAPTSNQKECPLHTIY
jgi:hypothetical protein